MLKDYPNLKLFLFEFLQNPSQVHSSTDEVSAWQKCVKEKLQSCFKELANNQKSRNVLKANCVDHPFWKIANALEFQASLHPILKDVYLFVAGQIRNYLVQEHLKMVLEDVKTRRKWQVI